MRRPQVGRQSGWDGRDAIRGRDCNRGCRRIAPAARGGSGGAASTPAGKPGQVPDAESRRHRARPRYAARVRRRGDLVAPARGPQRRAPDRPNSRSPISPARSPASCRAAMAAAATSIPTSGWSPRSSARSTTSSSTPWRRPSRRSRIRATKPKTQEQQERTGVLIGSGIGGLSGIADTALLLKEKGPRRVSPFFIPGRLINLASGYVSIRHGLKGPNHAVVTACSTGAHAIGDAARLIVLGDADVMVAGGAESPICRIAMAGFAACRALCDDLQRPADEGLAPLRQGPRRLRHGRGRRHRRARKPGARQGARRAGSTPR